MEKKRASLATFPLTSRSHFRTTTNPPRTTMSSRTLLETIMTDHGGTWLCTFPSLPSPFRKERTSFDASPLTPPSGSATKTAPSRTSSIPSLFSFLLSPPLTTSPFLFSRERLRNTFASSSWDAFNASILSSPLPSSSSITTFLFDKPEIIPAAVHGTHVFRSGKRLDGGEADLTEKERKSYIRRGVESQFLSFRSRVKGVLGGGEKSKLKRVFVAGGGSVK